MIAKVNQVGERQIRALAVFLLEDLAYYPDRVTKHSRLDSLSNRFGYEMQYYDITKLGLDNEQLMRLNLGDPVVLFEDGVISQSSAVCQ